MDWLHCNDCFRQPQLSPGTSFVLTSCARIQCTACNSTNSCINRECKPCRSQNYSAVALDDTIPPAVEDYFCDPIDHLKKYIKVNDFQRGHRDRLSKHLAAQKKNMDEKMAAKDAQLVRFTAESQNQQQKFKAEQQQSKNEIELLKLKCQQLETLLAKERSTTRPVANMYRNSPVDTYIRKAPTPSTVERALGDGNNVVSWQHKVPNAVIPPDRPGPIRQRYTPVQQQQPYKSRVGKQFFAPETPMYFPNNSSSAPVAAVKASNNFVSKQQLTYPTPPVYRPRPTASIGIQQAPKQPQIHHQQPKQSSSYNRVYAFMTEAARQALTPDGSKQ